MPFEPVTPQVDDTAADTGSLVDMGWVEEPPVPTTGPQPAVDTESSASPESPENSQDPPSL
ncbi:hypothetical protein ACIQ7D_17515 [Streptomyces sp. NPDC096310]|uniref:hypothetical protein n=1 Tax=Streptomyces sp. NPDC096310 TaxID=3366082 RepID=UPI00382FC98E